MALYFGFLSSSYLFFLFFGTQVHAASHCLQSRGADPMLTAGELDPYLAPGRKPTPSEMACDEEIAQMLRLIEGRYKDTAKVG